MLKAVGIDMSEEEYSALGRRVWNLVRLFNLKQGWTADDDYVPAAIHNPLEDSGKALAPEVFEAMKRDYYERRGWDEAGKPTAGLIADLRLGDYA